MSSKRRNKKRRIMEQKRIEENMTEHTLITSTGQDAQETGAEPHQAADVQRTAPPAAMPETPKAAFPSAVQKTEEPFSSVEIPAKKEVEKNLFLQYNDLEFSDHLMFEASINDYCKKTGVPAGDIESVNLYVKPQEGKAYYVINHDGEKNGSIDL